MYVHIKYGGDKKKEISVFGRFAFTGDFHSVLAKSQKP